MDGANTKRRIAECEQDREQLAEWIEDVNFGTSELLRSRRWRIGNTIGNIWTRLCGRRVVPTAADYLDQVLARFQPSLPQNRRRLPERARPRRPISAMRADIVICVHNALDDVRYCLESVRASTGQTHRLILADDGSDVPCREYLEHFANSHSADGVSLLRSDNVTGYTRAANRGLRASSSEYVVLLNSDTIVTPGWLNGLIEVAETDDRIGMVGPISNAASWQSVPARTTSKGDWSANPLPPGWGVADMAELLADTSKRAFPRVPLLNGFCLAIKRHVLDQIGLFDEISFPEGYGEENDFCLRAADAGWEMAVADHVYVFHAKSRSYGDSRRRVLSGRGQAVLQQKYGRRRVTGSLRWLETEPDLEGLRKRFRSRLTSAVKQGRPGSTFRILFLLPVRGGGGGTHSVVQEANDMRTLGVDAKIAVPISKRASYRANYAEYVEQLFLFYEADEQIMDLAGNMDVVVGTIYHSMSLVQQMSQRHSDLRAAYYIQDYEPMFFSPGSPAWHKARQSYRLVNDAILFAKTDWLCRQVGQAHGVHVQRVIPSIDQSNFYPNLQRAPSVLKQTAARNELPNSPVRIAAMVRPSTPRRAATRTMSVLVQVARRWGDRVTIHIYGCTDDALRQCAVDLHFSFHNHGILTRHEAAEQLRAADLFLDLSDYQAFGRTALEAMACGCAVIVPRQGGAVEFAIDRQNALVVDTSSTDACIEAVNSLLRDPVTRLHLARQALLTASQYSIRRAVLSELLVLQQVPSAGDEDLRTGRRLESCQPVS